MYIFVEHLFLFAEYKPVTLSIDNVILLTVSKCNTTTRCSDSGRPSGGDTSYALLKAKDKQFPKMIFDLVLMKAKIFLSFLSLPENLL